jgi:uncharacterized protein YecE (DUF72 family)
LEIITGCSGWSYTSWQGPLYPSNLESRNWLAYYSNIFDYVEIHSTFYRTPAKYMVQNWANRTPDNFKFTAKFPKVITHEKKFRNVENELSQFYEAMIPLKKKLLALLIQLPPYLKITEGLEALKQYDFYFDDVFRYAVEVRHHSWFNELAYNFFKNNNICMVWSQQDKLVTPPIVTSDFVYLRLIGDRSIDEKDFGKIQKNRTKEIQRWVQEIKNVQKYDKSVLRAIISANNHYAGFGPTTVNTFREIMKIPQISLEQRNDIEFPKYSYFSNTSDESNRNSSSNSGETKQTSISDFLG